MEVPELENIILQLKFVVVESQAPSHCLGFGPSPSLYYLQCWSLFFFYWEAALDGLLDTDGDDDDDENDGSYHFLIDQ